MSEEMRMGQAATAVSAASESPAFLLQSPGRGLHAAGRRAALPAGALATLAARVGDFFAATPEGPQVLVGAIPYDRAAPDALFQPAQLRGEMPVARPAPVADGDWTVTAEPPVTSYQAAVAAALVRIGAAQLPALQKVVLSRSLRMRAGGEIDPAPLLAQLRRDPSATVFSTPLPERQPGVARRLIGATPELLVSRQGRAVVSHPLAGSAPRSGDGATDQAAGAALLASAKDQHEHALVVEAVLDTLAPFCAQLGAPDGTTLHATATMWHLGTRITGTLRDPATPVAELLAALHPTPAVCGLPRVEADRVLRDLEGYDRGFYAGAVGWLDAAGDGAWYVALRCAEVEADEVRLYAGAGIVPGSRPEGEAAETSAKFLAMLRAMGIDEAGHPLYGQVA